MLIRIICLLTALVISTDALCTETDSLRKENQLLEAELKLAKKPNIYFVFDLKGAKVYLKARGTVFKEMDVEGMRAWGGSVPIKPVSLLKKSTFFKPKREKIKPRETDEAEEMDTFEVEALELSDMPASYSLFLEEGILITVRPKPEGLISGLCSIGRPFKWYISRPILTVWNAIMGRPFRAIELTLKEKDAQALYWSFYEGTGSIIYHPQN